MVIIVVVVVIVIFVVRSVDNFKLKNQFVGGVGSRT